MVYVGYSTPDLFTAAPWYEDWFMELYYDLKVESILPIPRMYVLYQLARQACHLSGDFAECGVWKGGTAKLIGRILKSLDENQKVLHLFDTFAGMPDFAKEDASRFAPGEFGDTSLDSVKALLEGLPVEFYPGIIPQTFDDSRLANINTAFVHIDVDLYKSVLDSTIFFYSRMVPGGIMLFDDYGFRRCQRSARQAVDEFFADKPEIPLVLQTGQSFVIKL